MKKLLRNFLPKKTHHCGGWALLFLVVALLPNIGLAKEPPCTTSPIETTQGIICGLKQEVQDQKVDAYLGIPYAESTEGMQRWTAPVLKSPFQNIFSATRKGPLCPQTESSVPLNRQSEDCLNLNIWSPIQAHDAETPLFPVIVFFPGGSFLHEGNSYPIYNGRRLAALGQVVVVTMNYRLGVLGFLAGMEELNGNYGILDQQLALKWLQRNVAKFGGDPTRMTLMGQSAGAMSVGIHLISPDSQPLFRAGIMESNPYALPYKNLAQARKITQTFLKQTGCNEAGVTCLRKLPLGQILKHQSSLELAFRGALQGFAGQLLWAPVVDGLLIPGQPNQIRIQKPILLGTNRNEGTFFAGAKFLPKLLYEFELLTFFPMKKVFRILGRAPYVSRPVNNRATLSQLLTDYLFTCSNRYFMMRAQGPVFAYQFDQVPSFNIWPHFSECAPDREQVCHGAELPFVFGNPDPILSSLENQSTPTEFSPGEAQLSQRMMAYWTSFATNLDPNQPNLPPWPPLDTKYPIRLILNEPISISDKWEAPCDFWDAVGYDLIGIFQRILTLALFPLRPFNELLDHFLIGQSGGIPQTTCFTRRNLS